MKIQSELKCLENILLSFYDSLLRARLWEHELFSVRSLAFISTLGKSPDEATMKLALNTKHSIRDTQGNVTSVPWWVLRCPWHTIVSCPNHTAARGNSERNITCATCIFTQWLHMRFESWVNFQNASLLTFSIYAKIDVYDQVRTKDFTLFSKHLCHLCHRCSILTDKKIYGWCVNI